MRRLLITGGSGYLGRELVRQAPASGWQTIATYHAHRPEAPDVEFARLDRVTPPLSARSPGCAPTS
jgi:dTDP-4-dehydrorhamnose reductase